MAPLRPSYQDYLRSDTWRAIRARYYRSRRRQSCWVCGSKRFELHHPSYDNLGHETLDELVPLCDRHHSALHRYARAHRGLTLEQSTENYLRRARLLVTDDFVLCDDAA